MRCAYFDCFGGAAGDMILAALVHAGLDVDVLREAIARLGLPGIELTTEKVRRGGLAATHVQVRVDAGAPQHRHLSDVLAIIARAGLPKTVAENAARIFTRLGEAEAAVHGISLEQVHFHEVGAADAMVDIVGACAGLEALQVGTVHCSPLPTGSGTVQCAHGTLPVPAPATAELLRGVPSVAGDDVGELTTPTGAAILTTLASSYGPLPAMRIDALGYGAGTRDTGGRPNILRLILGEVAESAASADERVMVLETQVDDATGQVVAFAVARTLEAGALDAFTVPILMKKGRPGQLVTVMCRPADVATMERILFDETTTFGIRRHECLRRTLPRAHVTVETCFGPIRVKVGRQGAQVQQAWPEYEDCVAAARSSNVPLRVVQDAALRAWAQPPAGHSDGRDG